MRRLLMGVLLALAAAPAFAQAKKEPIALRDMGSFHVGGRVIEITGQPVKEVVFTPGGVPAKVDPNGKYQVEQMYVQYFLPQNKKGKLPLLLWHGGGLSGVTYETKPDGGDGWMHYFIRKGWDTYVSDAMERGRSGWTSTFKGEADGAAVRRSVGALPHGTDRFVERRSGQARVLSGHAVSRRGLSAIHEAGRAALGHHRRRDRQGLHRTGRQDLPLRRAGAQPVGHVRLQGAGGAARQGEGAGCGRADARRRQEQDRLGEGHADPRRDWRQRQGASALEEHPAEQRDLCGGLQGRRAAASSSSICPTSASRATRT